MYDDVYPIPEALRRQDVAKDGSGWAVESGRAVRGDAWTSVLERKMRVPTANTETARVIRAHEMMHAKISPQVEDMRQIPADFRVEFGVRRAFSLEAMTAAEEFRVNSAIIKQGFNVDHLVDGSELRDGRLAAQSTSRNARADAFVYAAGLVGTKGFNAYVRGIKETRPDWAIDMRYMAKRMKQQLGRPNTLGSWQLGTTPHDVNGTKYPQGFVAVIPEIAKIIDYAAARIPDLENTPRGPNGRGTLPDYDDNPGGWDRLIMDSTVKLDIDQGGKMGKRYRPAMTGRRLGNPSRMLTDPYRRVFKSAMRDLGGIVLIDQSGSMSLSEEQVEHIVAAAPGATVLGYSSSGDKGEPNIWLHAKKGKRASYLHEGNGGNGVDGPALAYAISIAKSSDPIIWVTDGHVTGSGDSSTATLAHECAVMVMENRVHMVYDVEGAIKLMQGSRSEMRKTSFVGPVMRAANRILERKGH